MLTLPYTETHDVKSKFNDHEYRLFIRYPNDYKTSGKSYQTIYLIDPHYLFTICYDVRRIYENYIIVGIGHKDLDYQELDGETANSRSSVYRPRDFLPWKIDLNTYYVKDDDELNKQIYAKSGRAGKFAEFIKHQVIPLIDKNYRTLPNRTFIGHSFGGVFCCYMLLCHPEYFTNYLAIAPVLSNDHYEDKIMLGTLKKQNLDSKKLAYFSIDQNEKVLSDYEKRVENSCAEISKTPMLTSKFEIVMGENHASVVTPSIWRGLNYFDSQK